ncbi:MAG: ATP-binding cassette domain-containing protein [Alphaproteobacteria bacterium]|nr:ATP-binding cassette domain-containing protein [Alphaproteobacteria bacterium]MCB9985255.1 ATP-binding cassette domain-containing protein [Micavibrio sp.]HRK98246.1 ATP-binding cassette domain-containing protein [Alphaproteobacteria bacterium]
MIKNDPSYLIRASNLIYDYGTGDLTQSVLKGANLEVCSGEFVILAGPSGSGKSTLLSLIGALRKIQGGELSIVGCDLRDADDIVMRKIRRQVGYVFQQHNLLGFLTALQNVEMTLEMFSDYSERERHDLAVQTLQSVGLRRQMDSYSSQLSVGQKQRVAIARSLVHQPKVILADEPTASLDSKTGLQVVEILHGMVKNTGCGALIVTHDHRIFEYADRILNIEDGVVTS